MPKPTKRLARILGPDGHLVQPSRTRQAVVVARDPATRTCSLNLGGDATVVAGVDTLVHYVPRVGDVVWVDQTGPRLLIIGGQGTKLPAARIRRTTDGAIVDNTVTAFPFTPGSGGVEDVDTDGMVNLAANDTRITIGWPGLYALGGGVLWGTTAGAGRRIVSVRLNGNNSLYLCRNTINPVASATDPAHTCSTLYPLVAGDYLELVVFQSSGVGINVVASGVFSPVLWATWQGPA